MLADREFLYEITERDQEVYERVLPPKSRLLDALENIDWDAFDAKIRGYYCKDLGQPAYPPLRMLKLELLRYFYNLSDREVVDRCWTDLLFRYFLQIGITAPLPDPTGLTRFRGRLGAEGFRELFDEMVRQARAVGLIRDRLRLKDASHIIAAVAIPTTLGLLGQLRDRMLAAIKAVDPDIAEGFRIDLITIRESTEGCEEETKLQSRVKLVKSMLQWMEQQPSRPEQPTESAWENLLAVRKLAEKILGDLADPTKGDRTVSVVDPDARCGKHGDYYDGYLLDVMMDSDSEMLTSMDVLPANADEAADAIALIEHEQKTHANHVERLSIDGIGFNGEVLHELENAEGLNVEVFTPPRDFNTTEGFSASAFEFCEDGTRVRCPAGELSGRGGTKDDKPNTTFFRFPAKACRACPLLPQCHPGMKEGSRTGRRVSKNKYEAAYERARDKALTAEYHAVRQEHPAIERKLNELLRHHCSRRAKYWGLAKVKIQQLMTGLVVNVKRFLTLCHRAPCTLA